MVDFIEHRSIWNQILGLSITVVPFLRHEFQSVWWNSPGGGEWDLGELWIASGLDGAGNILGIAPLFRNVLDVGEAHLLFIITSETADYLDLSVTADYIPVFIGHLFTELDKFPPQIWEKMELSNLTE
jgi:hypothetical protein